MRAKVNRGKPASGIKTIADELGLSVATVDRALHNRGRISEETRARVLLAAAQLEYVPNLAARHLRLNRHYRISVNFPTTIAAFYDSLRAGIEDGIVPYRSVLELDYRSYERGPGQAENSIQTALDAQVEGIIAAPENTLQISELVRKASGRSVPVIYVSTDVPESGRLTAVIAHPFFCGTMAAEVLAGCLKKRGKVAILSGSLENLNHTEKIRGFRSMIAQLDPTSSVVEVVETRDDPKEAYRAIRRLMRAASPGIDGLYVTSANSIPALEALRDLGRLEQCAIVTTDLFPELVSFIREGIVRATVYQCPEVQGKIAIRAMYEYLMEKIMPPPSIGVTPQLVMRSNLDLYVRDSGQLSNTPLPI